MALAPEDRKAVATLVRAYIARERISRETFARRAKIGKSTVDKLVTGIVTEKTIIQIEEHLKLKLRTGTARPAGIVAAADYGGYTYEEAQRYFGTYILIRPAFTGEHMIYAYPMEIVWKDDVAALSVVEKRNDSGRKAQFGFVHMPRGSLHLSIVANEGGWINQALLSALSPGKSMKGLLLTMGNILGNVFSPVSVPIVMLKVPVIQDSMSGQIKPGHEHFERYQAELSSVEEEDYGRWIRIGKTTPGKVA